METIFLFTCMIVLMHGVKHKGSMFTVNVYIKKVQIHKKRCKMYFFIYLFFYYRNIYRMASYNEINIV